MNESELFAEIERVGNEFIKCEIVHLRLHAHLGKIFRRLRAIHKEQKRRLSASGRRLSGSGIKADFIAYVSDKTGGRIGRTKVVNTYIYYQIKWSALVDLRPSLVCIELSWTQLRARRVMDLLKLAVDSINSSVAVMPAAPQSVMPRAPIRLEYPSAVLLKSRQSGNEQFYVSGVCVNEAGLILTILSFAKQVKEKGASFLSKSYGKGKATVVAENKELHLALLQANTKKNVPFAQRAKSVPSIGDEVFGVGHDEKKPDSFSTLNGKVEAVDGLFITHTIKAYSSFKGAPLFNDDGLLVGIHYKEKNGKFVAISTSDIESFITSVKKD